jgi:osmotically-inducible protein OsmY
MKRTLYLLLLLPVTVMILNGCAGAVVGGAAAGAAVIHDRRTAGTVLDDQIIELESLNRIHKHKKLHEQTHVNFTSYNLVLLITGEAPTEEMRNQVYDVVKDISKVKRIHNELIVAAPSSFMSRSSDSWIDAKVKTRLFQIDDIEGFDPTRINVVTENGSVFLMGLVTRREADAVTEVARTTDGVQRVIKVFEYLD